MLCIASASEIAEVRRPAADLVDDVERRHDEPGSVPEDADLAVELHVRHALLAGEPLLRVARLGVAHLRDVGVPVEGIVVDGELRVERLHLAGRRDDQRVDLAEHRVAPDEGLIELPDDREHLLLLAGILESRGEDEPARLERLEAGERVDVQAREGIGVGLGNLFDVDAALRGEHEERLLLTAIERDREVVLTLDLGGLLDPDAPYDVPADVHPEDVARPSLGVIGRVGELDASGLAAAAGQDLRLDDNLAAELLGGRPGLLRSRGQPPLGHGDSEARKKLLSLILVEIHPGAASLATPL